MPRARPPSRRALLAGLPAAALAACEGRAQTPAAAVLDVALRDVAPFPIGTAVMTGQIEDPAWRALADRHVNQLTPEWEMKMERILKDDGSYDFSAADRIAEYAAATGKRLFGHALIWYAQESPAFAALDGSGGPFARAYRNYVAEVAGRYRGRAVAWDVVNEPVAEDGDGYRDCVWRRNLGMAYVDRAFEHAREADPQAVLFLNDYNLESLPRKRAAFLRLVEALLKRGVPVTGVGTQSHVDVELAPGAFRAAVRELAGFGLPVHVSELDVSFGRGAKAVVQGDRTLALKQGRVVEEAVQALLDLPPAQRFGLTIWGLRDGDSWLRRPPNNGGLPVDRPLLFDDAGRPKPAFEAVARTLATA
jgi:endo-1,4-beta-xylanase